MKNFLSVEALTERDINDVISLSEELKRSRGVSADLPLKGQVWAMIFTKSSTRTRVSFEVGISELGGTAMFLSSADTQLGRGEPVKDTARVVGRMARGAIIRTFAQSDVEEFADFSGIPTVNALTDEEHPCQILADLFTIREKFGTLEGRSICFVGDGACNVCRSWIWAAARLGLELEDCCSAGYQPAPELLQRPAVA